MAVETMEHGFNILMMSKNLPLQVFKLAKKIKTVVCVLFLLYYLPNNALRQDLVRAHLFIDLRQSTSVSCSG